MLTPTRDNPATRPLRLRPSASSARRTPPRPRPRRPVRHPARPVRVLPLGDRQPELLRRARRHPHQLSGDLASASTTPNFVVHHPEPVRRRPRRHLRQRRARRTGPGRHVPARPWCRRSPASPAFKQDGLLIVTFDEAVAADATACCGEIPGPGRRCRAAPARVAAWSARSCSRRTSRRAPRPPAVQPLLDARQHRGPLRPAHLAEANGPTPFGADVFTNPPKPVAPKVTKLGLKPNRYSHRHPGTTVSWTDSEVARASIVVEQLLPGYAPPTGAAGRSVRASTARRTPRPARR